MNCSINREGLLSVNSRLQTLNFYLNSSIVVQIFIQLLLKVIH